MGNEKVKLVIKKFLVRFFRKNLTVKMVSFFFLVRFFRKNLTIKMVFFFFFKIKFPQGKPYEPLIARW